MTWPEEQAAIVAEAVKYGVDARFIETIRRVENGRPGRDFGVLSVHANDYASQLREACISVAHRLYLYDQEESAFEYGPSGLRYSVGFIKYFAGIWAPSNADNDPAHLNAHWLANAVEIYSKL